jgi:hypothetical protein
MYVPVMAPHSRLATCAPISRGLHPSTFRLNVSASVERGVHVGFVQGVFRIARGDYGVFSVYVVSETAQVELKGGRV